VHSALVGALGLRQRSGRWRVEARWRRAMADAEAERRGFSRRSRGVGEWRERSECFRCVMGRFRFFFEQVMGRFRCSFLDQYGRAWFVSDGAHYYQAKWEILPAASPRKSHL
jgi:hypothetical protein